jgi:hypothetical protein
MDPNNPLDVERYRLPAGASRAPDGNGQPSGGRRRLPRHKVGEEFLFGPVPVWWLAIAGGCSGKAVSVGLALWFKTKATGRVEVSACPTLLAKFGVGRKAGYAALKKLAAVGLVRIVEQRPGRCSVVTILERKPNA